LRSIGEDDPAVSSFLCEAGFIRQAELLSLVKPGFIPRSILRPEMGKTGILPRLDTCFSHFFHFFEQISSCAFALYWATATNFFLLFESR
jgi:hypothetical protein